MRNLLYPLLAASFLSLNACSTIMNNLPWVYTLDIQQGNIVNQDMIDQLRPNMTKRQVLYVMGSSMLIDVFHQKRWDYLYSDQPGGEARLQKRISLFFEDDILIAVQGDFKPSTVPVVKKSKEVTLDIPERDLDKTMWEKITGLFSDDPPTKLEDVEIDDEENSALEAGKKAVDIATDSADETGGL